MAEDRVDQPDVEEPDNEVEELRKRIEQYEVGWPPGHFYSPDTQS
jgi:hypothetical protein